jgi:hypothetical protein
MDMNMEFDERKRQRENMTDTVVKNTDCGIRDCLR